MPQMRAPRIILLQKTLFPPGNYLKFGSWRKDWSVTQQSLGWLKFYMWREIKILYVTWRVNLIWTISYHCSMNKACKSQSMKMIEPTITTIIIITITTITTITILTILLTRSDETSATDSSSPLQVTPNNSPALTRWLFSLGFSCLLVWLTSRVVPPLLSQWWHPPPSSNNTA